jgi:hypothetical protein
VLTFLHSESVPPLERPMAMDRRDSGGQKAARLSTGGLKPRKCDFARARQECWEDDG